MPLTSPNSGLVVTGCGKCAVEGSLNRVSAIAAPDVPSSVAELPLLVGTGASRLMRHKYPSKSPPYTRNVVLLTLVSSTQLLSFDKPWGVVVLPGLGRN